MMNADDKRLNEMIAGMKLYAEMPYGIKINEFSAKDLYSAMVELRALRTANLQAQVAVLRDVLYFVRDEIDSYGDKSDHAILLETATKALSTTPAEAGERVRGLMEALEYARSWHRTPDEKPSEDGREMHWDGKSYISDSVADKITDALAKYQGGASNA